MYYIDRKSYDGSYMKWIEPVKLHKVSDLPKNRYRLIGDDPKNIMIVFLDEKGQEVDECTVYMDVEEAGKYNGLKFDEELNGTVIPRNYPEWVLLSAKARALINDAIAELYQLEEVYRSEGDWKAESSVKEAIERAREVVHLCKQLRPKKTIVK